MKCFTCNKITGNYKLDKETCASCREVLKIDLVRVVLEKDPIYLSESNRNKKGRKEKFTAEQKHDIYQAYNQKQMTMEELAEKYGASSSTIHKTIHRYGHKRVYSQA